MGIVVAFIFGCLVTVWWKARPQKVVKQVSSVTQNIKRIRGRLRTPEKRGAEINASKVVKNPVIDDELKEVLLEYAINQIRKGKIKVVEDED